MVKVKKAWVCQCPGLQNGSSEPESLGSVPGVGKGVPGTMCIPPLTYSHGSPALILVFETFSCLVHGSTKDWYSCSWTLIDPGTCFLANRTVWNDTVWLLRLGSKEPCSYHLGLWNTCFGCHAGFKKPKSLETAML